MNRRHFIGSIPALAGCLVAGGASAAAFPFSVKKSETQLIARETGWTTREEARLSESVTPTRSTLEIAMSADCSAVEQQIAELAARLKALDSAESLFCSISSDIQECLSGGSDELIRLEGCVAAGANKLLVKIKLGPVLENHLTTLRAVQGDIFRHGGLRG